MFSWIWDHKKSLLATSGIIGLMVLASKFPMGAIWVIFGSIITVFLMFMFVSLCDMFGE
jgi:hypothetical protein